MFVRQLTFAEKGLSVFKWNHTINNKLLLLAKLEAFHRNLEGTDNTCPVNRESD